MFYVPEEKTLIKGGTTITKFEEGLEVIYLRIILANRDLFEPAVYHGVLYDFARKSKPDKPPTKIEHIIQTLEYKDSKAFKNLDEFEYEDTHIRCRGKLLTTNLFDINDSSQIAQQIITPTLHIYRSIDQSLG